MAESKELEDFVRSACVAIQRGVIEGLEIKYPIDFEVAVVIKKGAVVSVGCIIIAGIHTNSTWLVMSREI